MSQRTAARPTQLYDALVLGSELPGLVAGALLAKRGLRVLHVDHGSSGDRRPSDGFLLPNGAAVLPMLRAVPPFHALFEELGTLPAMGRALQPLGVGLQIVTPTARLELRPSAKEQAHELVRALGATEGAAAARQLADLLERGERAASLVPDRLPLPPTGWFERLRTSRLASRLSAKLGPLPFERGQPLGEPLLDLHPFFSDRAGEPSTLGFLRACLPSLLEPAALQGEGLLSLLRASIRGHRGDSLGDSDAPAIVEELILERGRFAGIRLQGQDAPHRARLGLAGVALSALRALTLQPRAAKKLERLEEENPATSVLRTWNLVLASEGIPPGMGELTLVSGFGGPALLVRVEPTFSRDGDVMRGLRTVTICALASTREASVDLEARVFATLEEVLPFHGRHLRLKTEAPQRSTGFASNKRQSDFEGAPLLGPIPRLILTNRGVLPGLGLEGSLLAGMRAACLAEEQIKKVKPS